MIDEFRTDVTKTRKDGSRGRLRIDYGDPKEPDAAVKWLWKFVDGARSAGEPVTPPPTAPRTRRCR